MSPTCSKVCSKCSWIYRAPCWPSLLPRCILKHLDSSCRRTRKPLQYSPDTIDLWKLLKYKIAMYLLLRQGQIQKSEQDGKSLWLHFPHHIGLMLSHSASLGQFWFWCRVQTNCDISDILRILYVYVICMIQGVPQYWLHFVFCYFVSFYSTKIQKLIWFKKIQEICYMIGTKILKIDSEIA